MPRNIIEDDDDSLSILDSLEDDPFADLNAGSVRSSVPERPAPKAEAASGSDEGVKRVKYYRAIQGFLQALMEAAPIFIGERTRNPGISEDELKRKVGGLCRDHLKLIDKCLEVNEADPTDIMLRYQRRSLAKNLASLYRLAPMNELEGLVDVASEWIVSSDDFYNTGVEYSSSDNMLNVKLALFSAALKSQLNLKGLWCSFTPSEVILKLQTISLSLSKEVAFNWSKRSQISDQDSLFLAALPQCLEIAEMAYRDMVLRDLPEIEYIHSDPEFPLKHFEASVDSMAIGYEGEYRDKLFERMRKLASNYLSESQLPALELVDATRWRSAFIGKMDEMMALSWNDAADELFEDLSKMDLEGRAAYAANHQRMDLSRFLALLTDRLGDLECPLADSTVDFDRVLERARRHLAWLWGISDSLIAARNEDLPEEHT
jgi:hypothetical protein